MPSRLAVQSRLTRSRRSGHESCAADVVTAYINDLRSQLGTEDDINIESKDATAAAADDVVMEDAEPPFPALYSGTAEDFDKAGDLKQEAAELSSSGDWEAALEKYTEAVLAAPPSPLLLANRATALLHLGRPRAAERDCNEALKENPDSAKALRVRGKARKELGLWEAALQDLSASQQIDFDEGTVEDLNFLTEKRIEMEKAEAAKRIEEEERLRKKVADIKKAQEESKQREAEEKKARSARAAGMPGMGGMPDMGGMPGGMGGFMGEMMKDPELMAALQNPKVMQAFAQAQQDPSKLADLMSDPEVGPLLQKMTGKFGFGGAGGAGAAGAGVDDDDADIPNIDENDDIDLDELPDLE